MEAVLPPKGALDRRSIALRRKIVDMLACAGRGHLGSSLSLVEILRVLYDDILRFDPRDPKWPGRDRFILSKGHGCLAQYVLLAEKGFFPESELSLFCTAEGILGGHPDALKVPGIEASTGALGHGLSIGVGMAMAARIAGTDQRVFVVVGDGECNEGSIWEAALSAGNRKLANLCLLVDYNKNQSYDTTFEVQDLEPFADKWTAFGFTTREVDGHDVAALRELLAAFPLAPDKPTAIICHTVKGKGIGVAEGNLEWHHKSNIKSETIKSLLADLEAPHA
jgi:transketolase